MGPAVAIENNEKSRSKEYWDTLTEKLPLTCEFICVNELVTKL